LMQSTVEVESMNTSCNMLERNMSCLASRQTAQVQMFVACLWDVVLYIEIYKNLKVD
jgi:hypothetical protein